MQAAFAKLDADGDGVVTVEEVAQKYCASRHPDVVSGRRSEREVLREFLDTYDGGDKDGLCHLHEFEAYYAGVSASIDHDEFFEIMMKCVGRGA